MLWPLSQSSRNLRSGPSDEMKQVLPILTGGIGTIGLFDDGPIDFQFLGFFTKGIEQQIVKRNSLQIEPPQEFRFRPPHSAGPHCQHEEPAVAVSVFQAVPRRTVPRPRRG